MIRKLSYLWQLGCLWEKQVTLAQAAELAALPLADFIDLLRSKNIPWMEYAEEHLDEDHQAIQEILSSKKDTI